MCMEKQQIISNIAREVEQKLSSEGTGHDWWHIVRVQNMARHIGEREGTDLFVVELAALLHDIADWKFHDGDEQIGPRTAEEILSRYKVPKEICTHVCNIISHLSFKGANIATPMSTREGAVVQDADRLDAIGAIGIARACAYGGYKHRLIHDPRITPTLHQTKEAYFANENTTINHFYEKLLLLKDRMNTQTAQTIAQRRHEFMEKFLEEFNKEWDGA